MNKVVGAMILLCAFIANFPVLAQAPAPRSVEVIVAPVVEQSFSDKIEALGTVKANETVVITANTTETITGIFFEDGQHVKKGAVLVTLGKSEEEADLRAAQAQLSEAQASYDRALNLQESNALSSATLQNRFATLQQAEARIGGIKARIKDLVISAPFDGILGLRDVSIGTLVHPGDAITTMDDLSKVKVDFNVPDIYLQSLQAGLPITGKVDAFQDKVFTGSVQNINTQIDPVTRSVTVRAVLDNADHSLKPGLLMNLTLHKNVRTALVIPEESLIKRGEKNFVFTVFPKDGKLTAMEKEVQIGTRTEGFIEILGGISKNEQIVTHGIIKLRDGAEIKIVTDENNMSDSVISPPVPLETQKGK